MFSNFIILYMENDVKLQSGNKKLQTGNINLSSIAGFLVNVHQKKEKIKIFKEKFEKISKIYGNYKINLL